MKVIIAYGGWSCAAGYVSWAYVAEAVEPNESYKGKCVDGVDCYTMSRIGGRLYCPPNKTDINDSKNCGYGKEPNPEPRHVCEKWIKDKGYELVEMVKMRVD